MFASRRVLICLLLLSSLPATLFSKPADKPAKTINVGVVYYKDFEETLKNYKEITDGLTNKTGGEFVFRLAVGTYDDVLEWYKKGEIDVAVMTPGMISILLNSTDMEEEIRSDYIATLGTKPLACETFAKGDRLKHDGDGPFSYFSVALMPKQAAQAHGISTIEELLAFDKKRLAENKPGVKFVFVHPLSVSGHILPKMILQEEQFNFNFKFNPSNYEWTYNHDESLRQLIRGKPNETPGNAPLRVAFIADETKVVTPDKKDEKCGAKKGAKTAKPASAGGITFSKEDFLQLTFPALDNASLPQDVLLLSPASRARNQMRERGASEKEIRDVLLTHWPKNEDAPPLRVLPDWLKPYKRVSHWLEEIDPQHQLATPFSSLDQIVARLINYDGQSKKQARNGGPRGARLALVLSGGGAKCAYQLGAVEALEQELGKHLDENKKRKVDISLVVGTSGGAINALCVALGITSDEKKQHDLRETWKSFRQENFLQPWWQVRLPIGLLLGLLQAILLMRITLVVELVASRWTDRINFWALTGGLLIILGVSQCLVDKLNIQISEIWTFGRTYLYQRTYPSHQVEGLFALPSIFTATKPKAHGMNHLLLHSWAVLAPTFIYSGLVLVVTGVCMVVGRNHPLQKVIARAQTRFEGTPFFAAALHLFMSLVLSRRALISYLQLMALVCLITMILLPIIPPFNIHSLSDSEGVEQALAREVPKLCNSNYKDQKVTNYALRLEEISEEIVRENKLKRDMVITGSRLPATVEEIEDERYRTNQSADPDDMYFYYDHRDDLGLTGESGVPPDSSTGGAAVSKSAHNENVVPSDRRFVPFKLKGNSRKLLDVVIGSSSIYPMFQPRTLKGIRLSPGDKGREVKIIDGGFVHNSPIEAAILWGATHIILIEATPAGQPSEQQNLYSNALSAFDYLYTQAQIIDARSRGKIEIFTLRPLPARPGEDLNSDLLDFSADLIEGAISKGYNDALNIVEPRFRREPGPPQF